MNKIKYIITFFFVCCFALLGSFYANAQSVKIDERIRNQAVSTFLDRESGYNVEIYSNTVQTRILPYSNIELLNDIEIEVSAGAEIKFYHTIENKGNQAQNVKIGFEFGLGNEFDVQDVFVQIIEVGTNRVVANTPWNEAQDIELMQVPDIIYQLLIIARVSNAALVGEVANLEVYLNNEAGENIQNRMDSITIIGGTDLRITKFVDVAEANDGDLITYTLQTTNVGNHLALPLTVNVGGVNMQYVIVKDVIPVNTTLNSVLKSDGSEVLIRLEDSADDEYQVYNTNVDHAKVVEIGFGLPEIEIGTTFEAKFTVVANANISGRVLNTATVSSRNEDGTIKEITSNEVVVVAPDESPLLKYYQDDNFNNESKSTRVGEDLHIMAEAAACNESRTEVDEIQISLLSKLTSDYEVFTAFETGKNTGDFKVVPSVPTLDYKTHSVQKLSSTLETTHNDVVEASILNCGTKIYSQLASMRVSPTNVVYDSKNNRPIAGAVVTLVPTGSTKSSVNSNYVFDIDQKTPFPTTTITDKSGAFELPSVIEGEYIIEVTPPTEYKFPSSLIPALLPSNRNTDNMASYGYEHYHADDFGAITIDIPLDASAFQGLSITKETSKRSASIGDFVDYTLTVKNTTGAVLGGVYIKDELPSGFTYVKGTTLKENISWVDPDGDEGPVLTFNVGTLDDLEEIEITYRLVIGSSSLQGNRINKAQAFSADPLAKISNIGATKTEVQAGVFSEKGYLTGTVYYDINKNGTKDLGEDGIPGVRLYLNNGTFVITDGEGKYSLYGLQPQNHVLKIDPFSIPNGSGPTALTTRNAGDGFSYFVTIPKGGLEKVNIALCQIGENPQREIDSRRKAARKGLELESVTTSSLQFNTAKSQALSRVNAEGTVTSFNTEVVSSNSRSENAEQKPVTQTTLDSENQEQSAPANNKLDITNVVDGDTLMTSKATFKVKSPNGSRIIFTVNGSEISEEYIGSESKWAKAQVQLFEYVGLPLKVGENTLNVEMFDAFGNKRDELTKRVFAPGSIAGFDIQTSTNKIPANGKTTSVITITPIDEFGIQNNSEVSITLFSTSGTWLVNDLQPNEEGIQTFIKGSTEIEWMVSRTPEKALLEVYTGAINESIEINVTPDLRPFIASGLIEGSISLNGRDNGYLSSVSDADGFYSELEAFSYTSDNGEFKAGARTNFFLKGKVLGKYLLTMSYDSEKDKEDLFRDIQPDEFYPVYGDASIKGFEAQSTSNLYVRLDSDRTSVQYGDFVTQSYDETRKLGRYSRSLTGLKANFNNDILDINTYGSIAKSKQVIDEISGAGISGPYLLSKTDVVVNSEQVSIIVRDLVHSEKIIETKNLTRFVDYTLDIFTGAILLNQPVSTVNSDLNPVFIRVVYETESGNKAYTTVGVDAKIQATDNLEVGAVAVRDFYENEEYSLQSAHMAAQITKNLELIAEAARSEVRDSTSGLAARFELNYKTANTSLKIFGMSTDSAFYNPSSSLRSDRTQFGAKGRYKMNKSSLFGEYVYSLNDGITNKRKGASAGIETKFKNVRIEAGSRFSKYEISSNNQKGDNLTARAKVTSKIPGLAKAEIFGEFEQELRNKDRKVIGLGGSYEFWNRSKLYARHEFISSLGNRYDLDNTNESSSTVVGVDVAYSNRGKAYSEYRIREGMSGQEAQAALGLRNTWNVGQGIKLNAGFERIHQIRNASDSKSLALTSGIEYLGSDNWKGSGRLEYRRSSTSNYYFNTIGIGYKLNKDWTLLAKNFLAVSDYLDTNPTQVQNKTRIGAAYRNIEAGNLDALFRYEYKIDKKGNEQKVATHIGSAHAAFMPFARWRLSGSAAAKYSKDVLGSTNTEVLLGLLSGKAVHELTDKWDLGIQGSILASLNNHSNDYGFGIESGYSVARNTRVAAGFNLFGISDKDLVGSGTSQKGVYLTLSYKFDEQLFQGLLPDDEEYAYYNADCVCEEKQEITLSELEIAKIPATKLTVPALVSLPIPMYKVVNNIHFATDESFIDSTSAMALRPLVEYLVANEDVKIKVEGVTDQRGSIKYNLKLALRRATEVEAFLAFYGIDSSRIQLLTTGERVTETDKISFAMNREVNIYLIGVSDIMVTNQYDDLKEVEHLLKQAKD